MSKIEVNWTKDQARLVLASVLDRLSKDPSSFVITKKKDEVDISRHDLGNWVSICVYTNYLNRRIFISAGNYNGHAEHPSSWWWKDKEYKAVIKKVLALDVPTITDKLTEDLHKLFPEMMTIEFEQQVLIKK